MTKVIQSNNQGNLPVAGKYSLEDIKSFFYLMNAKPDTSIQLLEGRKRISISEIRDLNERINRKLQNHDLVGQIASINLIFEKGKIQDFATWAEFERENWHTINNKTEAISLTWDISIKLPKYENPQRHTLKVRIGKAISPKDMMELVFSSDNLTELRENRADGIVKVDFIDQVIAVELIDKVSSWYDGLKQIPSEKGIQKVLEKYHNLIVSIIFNFTPILFLSIYHYYFLVFCNWGNLSDRNKISDVQLLLIAFVFVYYIGRLFASKFAKTINKKIDAYVGISQFEITKGDENALHDAEIRNNSITRKILLKVFLTLLSSLLVILLRSVLGLFIN